MFPLHKCLSFLPRYMLLLLAMPPCNNISSLLTVGFKFHKMWVPLHQCSILDIIDKVIFMDTKFINEWEENCSVML